MLQCVRSGTLQIMYSRTQSTLNASYTLQGYVNLNGRGVNNNAQTKQDGSGGLDMQMPINHQGNNWVRRLMPPQDTPRCTVGRYSGNNKHVLNICSVA